MIKNHGNKKAITVGVSEISYGELFARIEQFSKLFEVAEGERVIIFSENRPGWLFAFLAIWNKSAVPVPVDFLATESELSYILSDSQPSAIFVSSEKKPLLEKAMAATGILAQIVLIDSEEQTQCGTSSLESLPPYKDDQTAVIINTSGTTGSPKGVMLSYGNLMTNLDGVVRKIRIFREDSRVMILLPLHHIFPLLGSFIAPLHAGGSVAISPSMTSEDMINTLNHNKITIIIGVPRLYEAIRKSIRLKIDQSPVAKALFALAGKLQSKRFSRFVFSAVHKKFGGKVDILVAGGAALDPEVGQDFKTLGFEVLEGFGMTEAAPMITFTRPGRVRIGSAGEVLPGTEMMAKDGEIIARGGHIMKGYYNNPEATAEVIKDGWLYTGDLGYIDKDGYLYITGRKKEIIVLSNGKNVNPAELEEYIVQSPLVSDCAVFFHDDRLCAVIVPAIEDEDHKLLYQKLLEEVIEPLNVKVSSYKRIGGLYITYRELPRTRLGKLQRFKLEELVEKDGETEEEENDGPVSEELRIITEFISAEKGRKVRPMHHLEYDLALDSLDRVGLQVFLSQNFGVEIEASEILRFQTVANLAEHVAATKTRLEEGRTDWSAILREKVQFKLPESWIPTRLAMRLSRYVFKLYFRYRTRGLDNIPDEPCIIASNHQSFFDGLFVASLLRTAQIGKTYFYAKAKHADKPIFKFLAQRTNVIVVDLNNNLKESIQKLAEVLRLRKNILIFPEGTRSANGNIGQFKKTFAILSRELNIPVVPVAIKGASDALPKGSIFPRPLKKVQVEFLEPLYPENYTYDQIANIVRNRIIETM